MIHFAAGSPGKEIFSVELFHEMISENLIPDVGSFNIVLSFYGKRRDWEKAESVFQLLAILGVSPNLVTFNTLLAMYAVLEAPETAEHIFREISKQGIIPDANTYASLVHLYSRVLNTRKAKIYFRKLAELVYEGAAVISGSNKISDGSKMPEIDPKIFDAMILMYSRVGMVEAAENFFNRVFLDKSGKFLFGVSPTLRTCNIFISACYHNERPDKAEYFMTNIFQNFGLIPDVHMHNHVLRLYCSYGDRRTIRRRFSEMKSKNLANRTTYSILVSFHAFAKQIPEVQKLLKEMSELGFEPQVSTWTKVMGMYGECRMLSAAEKIFKYLRTREDATPETYKKIIEIYKDFGKNQETKLLKSEIEKKERTRFQDYLQLLSQKLGDRFGFFLESTEIQEVVRRMITCDFTRLQIFSTVSVIIAHQTSKQKLGELMDNANVLKNVPQKVPEKNVPENVLNTPDEEQGKSRIMASWGEVETFSEVAKNDFHQMLEPGFDFLKFYHVLLDIFGDFGMVREVELLLERLEREGLTPTKETKRLAKRARGNSECEGQKEGERCGKE
jgi:pentatricopeptide repeat protein